MAEFLVNVPQLRGGAAEKCSGKSDLTDADINGLDLKETELAVSSAVLYSSGPRPDDAAVIKTSFFPNTKQWDQMLRNNPVVTEANNKALRNELKKEMPPFFIKGIDGSVKYDWTEIESVLKKDADQITPEEYTTLAMIYSTIDDKDLSRFLKCMTNKVGDITVDDRRHDHIQHKKYTEWAFDTKKAAILQGYIKKYSELFDKYNVDWENVVETKNISDEDQFRHYFSELDNRQNKVIQRAALLDTLIISIITDPFLKMKMREALK